MKTLTIQFSVSGRMTVDINVQGSDDDALDDAISRALEICQRRIEKETDLDSPSCEFDEVIDEQRAGLVE